MWWLGILPRPHLQGGSGHQDGQVETASQDRASRQGQSPIDQKGARLGKDPPTMTDINPMSRVGGMTPMDGGHRLGTRGVTRRILGTEMDSRLHLGKTDITNRDSPGLRGKLSTLGYPTYGIVPFKDAQLCFVVINASFSLSFRAWRWRRLLLQRWWDSLSCTWHGRPTQSAVKSSLTSFQMRNNVETFWKRRLPPWWKW